MRKTNKIIIAIILISVMLLSIGYAAIQNITLNIAGTATADPSQANFTVKFSETTSVSDASKVTAAVTDETNATINVEGLTTAGETVTATYIVQNTSDDLSADLTVETTNSNEEYFTISSELEKPSLTAGEAAQLTVTVELIKTPVTDTETATIGIQLTAEPVQPGEEGANSGSIDASGNITTATTSLGTYLPTGFREVAGTSLTNGLTIEDAMGNQYVWVDVPQDAYKAETLALDLNSLSGEELTNAYKAIEDDLHAYTVTYRDGTSFTDTWYDGCGIASADEYNALKNKMLKSIFENGGFYVGKYEAGILTNARTYEIVDESSFTIERPIEETAVVQANAYSYYWVRCSQAQELSSKLAAGGYTSSLMFGVQWDLMLKHIEVQAVKNGMEVATIQAILTQDSKDYGNCLDSEFTITNENAKYVTVNAETMEISEYASAVGYSKASGEIAGLTTGASEQFNLYGIYDIAGNAAEWTLEYTSYSSYPCAVRGGVCVDSGSEHPASYRGNNNATYSVPLLAFRPSIF